MMTNREAIETLERLFYDSTDENYPLTDEFGTAVNMAIEALQGTEWIPFTFDEKGTLNCTMPDEDEEILISNGKWVDIDTMCVDYDETNNCTACYLDSNRDLDGLAWKPLPKPWKGDAK